MMITCVCTCSLNVFIYLSIYCNNVFCVRYSEAISEICRSAQHELDLETRLHATEDEWTEQVSLIHLSLYLPFSHPPFSYPPFSYPPSPIRPSLICPCWWLWWC